MGYYSLLQQIFPSQGSNLVLLYCRQILYHLSHQGVGNQTVKLQEFLLVARAFAGHLVCSSVNWAPALWSALPKAPGTRCGWDSLSPALGGLLPATQSVTQDALQKEAGGAGRAQGTGTIELWLQQACCLPVSFMTLTSEFLPTRKRLCWRRKTAYLFFFSLGKTNKDTHSAWH